MRRTLLFLLLSVCLLPGDTAGQTPLRRRVLVIGIDGCRPDALIAANTPNIDGLISNGCVSYLAQTGDITSSGPGWSSLLTGVWRNKHNVNSNSFVAPNFANYPHFFTRLKQTCSNIETGSVVRWTPIHTYIVSGADHVINVSNDTDGANQAAMLLANNDVDVTFVHFDDVDYAGHANGFSPTVAPYLSAIEGVDTHVGTVLQAIANRPNYLNEDWLYLLSTDHGGTGFSHGGNTPEQRTIFYIASGQGAASGVIATPPNILDIPATVFDFLGLPVDPAWNWDSVSRGLSTSMPPSGSFPCVGCPTALKAAADQVNKTVLLDWNSAGPGLTGYIIKRDGVQVGTTPAGTTSFLDVLPASFGAGHVVIEYVVEGVGAIGPCTTNAVRITMSTGNVVFFDDFEGYATDADLQAAGWQIVDVNSPIENATWTITNPGNQFNPAMHDGRPGSGNFLISDSDWGGSPTVMNPSGTGVSHDVWSPAFNCQSLSDVYMHMDLVCMLNNNEGAVMYIDVSSDGGQTWQTMIERVSPGRTFSPGLPTLQNADGYYGRLTLDISASAAGQSSVMFRVRHYEPSWDWFVGFDNVFVDDLDLMKAGTNTVLAIEDFSAGLPASWSLQGFNTGASTWTNTDPCGRAAVAAGGTFPTAGGRGVNRLGTSFMILDSDCNPDPNEDEHMLTPILDCSAQTEVFLGFKSEYMPLSGTTAEVLISTDGGLTFDPDPIFQYLSNATMLQNNEDPVYGEIMLCVPRASGQALVVFAFRFKSAGNQWYWAIDDVHVTGSTNIIPGPGQAPRPGVAVLDVSGSIEQNGLSVLSGMPGPYSTSIASGVDDFIITLGGAPNQTVVVLSGPLSPGAFQMPGSMGQLDVGIPNPNPPFVPTGIVVLIDGGSGQLLDSFFNTGSFGTRVLNFGPTPIAPGLVLTLQTLVSTGGPTVIAASNAVTVTIY